MSIIEVNHMTKTYRNGKGIFDVTFHIEEGEVFGYLGPNGAGKTTTIRQLMGFTNANQGDCRIMGWDCRKDAHRIQNTVGYLPGEISFFDNMTGTDFLKFISRLRRSKPPSRKEEIIQEFQLDPTSKIRRMSKGMKQKLAIVTAFMHDPRVYILDEPTSGLDPLMQKKFIQLINQEKKRGKTILMSSHSFEEIDRTADRVGVIREGRLVAVDDINAIKVSQRKVFSILLGRDEDIQYLQSSNLEIGQINDRRVEITLKANYNELMQVLSKCDVRGIDVLSQSLEQAFMKYYGEEGEGRE